MKSALPKVLHPLLGRTPARSRAGRRRAAGRGPHRRRGRARRRPGPRAPGRGRAGRHAGAPGRAARHRARRPDRAGGGAGRGRHRRRASTATCRCCAPRRWPRWSRRTRTPARRRPCWPPRCPTRPASAGSCGTPTGAAGRRSSRSATPPRQQRAIREINAGIYAFDAARLARGAGQAHHRQRPGRGVPHRRLRAARATPVEPVAVHVAADHDETLGCNDRVELAALRAAAARPDQRGAGCAPA